MEPSGPIENSKATFDPPGREEMPDWFREELEQNEARRQVDQDTWRSNERSAGFRLCAGAALLGMVLFLLFFSLHWLLIPIGCLAGAIGGFFIHIFEFGASMGALVFAVILCLCGILTLSLIGVHPATIGPMALATATAGALLGIASESSRGLRRGL